MQAPRRPRTTPHHITPYCPAPEQVQPFSVVRAMACHSEAEVRQYLEQYIPPHRRGQPPADSQQAQQAQQGERTQQGRGTQGGQQTQQAQQVQQGKCVALAQHAAELQPAGAKRRPGRPRIHPPQEPKRPRRQAEESAPSAAPGETAAAAGLPGGESEPGNPAGAAAAGLPIVAGMPGGDRAALDGTAKGSGKKLRAKIGTLAERTFIQDPEKRQQASRSLVQGSAVAAGHACRT